MFVLVSSHALMSRTTLESGRAGRMGGRTGARDEARVASIGTLGARAVWFVVHTVPAAGAVNGRLRDGFRRMFVSSFGGFRVC